MKITHNPKKSVEKTEESLRERIKYSPLAKLVAIPLINNTPDENALEQIVTRYDCILEQL